MRNFVSQPVIKNFYKFWWNEELSALKEAAVSSNQLWKAAGKPRQGPIFDKRQLCKARYRKNLRDAQKLNTVSYTNDLHEALLAKDGPTFWRCWRSKFNSRLDCKQVGGCVDPELIANNFAQYFSEIYTPNSALHHYIMNIYHYVKITLVSHYQPTVFLIQNLSVRLFPTSNAGKPLIQLDLLLST